MYYQDNAQIHDEKREAQFYKCPVGGFASFTPRICPKCGEPLVPFSDTNAATNRPETETDQRRLSAVRQLAA